MALGPLVILTQNLKNDADFTSVARLEVKWQPELLFLILLFLLFSSILIDPIESEKIFSPDVFL